MRAIQTGYKRARGAVIVNVHSRYILIAAAYIIETEGRERERNVGNRGEKKATRDLMEEDRANNPASCRSRLAWELSIEGAKEIRERFEARLVKHPSLGCGRGETLVRLV